VALFSWNARVPPCSLKVKIIFLVVYKILYYLDCLHASLPSFSVQTHWTHLAVCTLKGFTCLFSQPNLCLNCFSFTTIPHPISSSFTFPFPFSIVFTILKMFQLSLWYYAVIYIVSFKFCLECIGYIILLVYCRGICFL
jgi:hypothetical protein